MKDSIKKILAIQIITLFIIIASFFLPFLFDGYLFLVFLLLVGLAVYLAIGLDIRRNPKSSVLMKNLLIYLMVFFILIYLSGLFIGFNSTIYTLNFTNLVKNIIPTAATIIVSEILRYQFIKKSNNNKLVIVLSFLIVFGIDLCLGFYNYNFNEKNQIYEYIGLVALASLTRNILMTLFCTKTDYTNAIVYRLVMELYIYIIPIVPGFGPYLNSIILIIFPIVLSFMTMNSVRKEKIKKPREKRKADVIFVIVLVILVSLVLINSGLLKYQSLVIGSDSMLPYMERGDVVVIEKLNSNEQKELKKGDIIVFRYDNKIISHRIYKIEEKEDKRYYVTKGDNNDQPDNGVRDDKNVIGVVRLKIDKIGLPSVWLSELFN